MSMMSEFKEFIAKGNVMDLAVGVIIGGAFGKIVDSLVNDVIMPPIGLLLGGVDFSNMHFVLKPGADGAREFPSIAAAQEAGAVTLNYGKFINVAISFLILAFVVFQIVRGYNKLRASLEKPQAEEAVAPAGPTQEELLTEIRDLLKKA